jgi:Domain of unknown function (DUF397)
MTSEDGGPSRAMWRRSSHSGGNGGQCVEVAAGWRKPGSTAGGGGQCAGAAPGLPAVVAVRDSKDPDGARLILPPATWAAFVDRVKREG